MRVLLHILLLTIIALPSFSCDQKPKNPVSEYGDAVIGAYKQTGNKVAETLNLDVLRTAVQAYQASHGTYPQSLDEVKGSIATTADLSRYDYNPENGSVSLRK